jgi:NitT/TauT family transport system ATP-binding protein
VRSRTSANGKCAPLVIVKHVRHVYRQRLGGGCVVAIEDLSLELACGEVVSIVGPSGCGKTTLLRLLLGLEQPTEGSVVVDGVTPYGEFRLLKGVFGTIFQDDALLPWRTALANVRLGLEMAGGERSSHNRVAAAWLVRVGLDRFAGAYPRELSGGMRQRVAMARAFAINPRIVLADEAFSHLDEVIAASLRRDFLDLVRSTRATAVLVTHDLNEALEMGDRTIVLGRPARLLAEFDCTDGCSPPRENVRTQIAGLLGGGPS